MAAIQFEAGLAPSSSPATLLSFLLMTEFFDSLKKDSTLTGTVFLQLVKKVRWTFLQAVKAAKSMQEHPCIDYKKKP